MEQIMNKNKPAMNRATAEMVTLQAGLGAANQREALKDLEVAGVRRIRIGSTRSRGAAPGVGSLDLVARHTRRTKKTSGELLEGCGPTGSGTPSDEIMSAIDVKQDRKQPAKAPAEAGRLRQDVQSGMIAPVPRRAARVRKAKSSASIDVQKIGNIFERVFEPDVALLAAAETELGPAPDPSRGHYVIDPGALRAAVGDCCDPDDSEQSSTEEASRMARLRRLAADPDALWKPHLVACAALIGRLEALRIAAPNAGEAIDIVTGAARISALTGAPLAVPPILLLGPAGCGKSRFARGLGRALESPVLTLLGSTMTDGTAVLGAGVGWRGAGPGRLAEMLLNNPTSSPLIFIDEVEKMRLWDRREAASDILLGLLDQEMASSHEDQYLRIPMHAGRALWICAANTLDGLSQPFLDRCMIIEMQPPKVRERQEVVRRIHAETRVRLGLASGPALDEGSLDLLADLSLRGVGPAVQIALGRAVAAGRDRLEADDIAWARAVVQRGREPVRQRMGFVDL